MYTQARAVHPEQFPEEIDLRLVPKQEVPDSDAPDFYTESLITFQLLQPILPEKVGLLSQFYSNGETMIPISAGKRPEGFDIHSIVLDARELNSNESGSLFILWQHTRTQGEGSHKSTSIVQLDIGANGLRSATEQTYDFQNRLMVVEKTLSESRIEEEQVFIRSIFAEGNEAALDDIYEAFDARTKVENELDYIEQELDRLKDLSQKPKTETGATRIRNNGDWVEYTYTTEITADMLRKRGFELEKQLKHRGLPQLVPREPEIDRFDDAPERVKTSLSALLERLPDDSPELAGIQKHIDSLST